VIVITPILQIVGFHPWCHGKAVPQPWDADRRLCPASRV